MLHYVHRLEANFEPDILPQCGGEVRRLLKTLSSGDHRYPKQISWRLTSVEGTYYSALFLFLFDIISGVLKGFIRVHVITDVSNL